MKAQSNNTNLGLGVSLAYGLGFVVSPFMGISPWAGGGVCATLFGIPFLTEKVDQTATQTLRYADRKIDRVCSRIETSLTHIENSVGETSREIRRVPQTLCKLVERISIAVTGSFIISQAVQIMQSRNSLNKVLFDTYCERDSSNLICYVVSAETIIYSVYDAALYGFIVYTVYEHTQDIRRISQNNSR